MSLRVSGGAWRGRRLRPAPGTRPTQERVREALLARWGERVAGARLVELFAGSGAVGIEALSRGAAWCGFVDRSPRALRTIERNLEACGAGDRAAVARAAIGSRGARLPEGWRRPFDLVFADPPYRSLEDRDLLAAIVALVDDHLAVDGELVIEHSTRERPVAPDRWEERDRRVYGDAAVSVLGRRSSPGRTPSPRGGCACRRS